MKKINLINLKNLTTNDYDKIKDLPLNLIFRYSLKLIRNYPSAKKEDMREAMILDYHDGKKFKTEKEIEGGFYQAKGFLHHLITYELIMKELKREDTNKFYHKFDLGVNHMNIVDTNKQEKNKKNKDYEYFE